MITSLPGHKSRSFPFDAVLPHATLPADYRTQSVMGYRFLGTMEPSSVREIAAIRRIGGYLGMEALNRETAQLRIGHNIQFGRDSALVGIDSAHDTAIGEPKDIKVRDNS